MCEHAEDGIIVKHQIGTTPFKNQEGETEEKEGMREERSVKDD